MQNRTLLLNATYEPLTVIAWQKAMTLVLLRKVEVLAHYDAMIRSARKAHTLPAVVRLTRRVSWRKLGIRFSRQHVYKRDEFVCQYCDTKFAASQLTLDHVMPRSLGGPTNWTNIVASCVPCNQRKADRTPERAGMLLARKPYAPYWMQLNIPRKEDNAATELWRPYLWT